jgi:hypothetical protein
MVPILSIAMRIDNVADRRRFGAPQESKPAGPTPPA